MYTCDHCQETAVGAGDLMHGCRVCDWDACNRCFRKAEREAALDAGGRHLSVSEIIERVGNPNAPHCFVHAHVQLDSKLTQAEVFLPPPSFGMTGSHIFH